jgi:two-component system, cell cycle sensor histidine kinase and response regulator CckA
VKRPLHLLIVEDSEDDAMLLLAELARGGFDATYLRVDSAEPMRAALAAQPWDVIVSDFDMPTFCGIGALGVLHETGLDIPLIIVSGTIGEDAAVEALRTGAADFVLKGRLARLIPAIEREMREAEGRRQRRSAEAELQQTRERMQFALSAAGVGLWEADAVTGVTTWSDVMEKLHGLLPGAFGRTRESFLERVHPDDHERVAANIIAVLRNPNGVPLEYRTTWPDGSVHWIAGLGRTVFDEHGRPARAAGVALDVTSQKELEDQFRQAQKLEAIGGLAAGIAHDFNNLLTIVSGYCELLAQRLADDPEALEDLNEIRHAGASATALTRQLLTFSRRQVVQPRQVDLNGVLTDSSNMLRRTVEKNVRIDLALDADLPLIRVDPGQLEQVLLNLVINARDAMPSGGVITIETRPARIEAADAGRHLDLAPGDYALMSVRDTGCGMTPEVRARLFEPFFTTKGRGRGTGLGLATVYGIVKHSGGHISVASSLGIGTTFEIYWPLAGSADRRDPATATAVQMELCGAETVLVVEDEAPLRGLAQRILQAHGYSVLLAANGDDAEDVCRSHAGPIHAVLMDVIMPGRSGTSVAEWMAVQRPEAKVIYVSGYTGNAIASQGALPDGAVVLQKPYPIEALLNTLREALA